MYLSVYASMSLRLYACVPSVISGISAPFTTIASTSGSDKLTYHNNDSDIDDDNNNYNDNSNNTKVSLHVGEDKDTYTNMRTSTLSYNYL